jgi:hypothetical protein
MQPEELVEGDPAGEDDAGLLGKAGHGKEEEREEIEKDGLSMGGTTGAVIAQKAPEAGPGGEKVGTPEQGGHGLGMNGVYGKEETRPKCRTDCRK